MYYVVFTSKAQKDLSKLPKDYRQQIIKKIEQLKVPESYYRLRHRNLRVLLEIDKKSQRIWIRRIGFRGSVYGLI